MIAFNCPNCNQELQIEDELAGEKLTCPTCAKSLRVAKPAHPPVTRIQAAKEKPCPACGETILAVAKKCKHCGEDLTPKPNLLKGEVKCANCGAIAKPRKAAKGSFILALLLFCLGGIPGLIYVCMTSGYEYLCPSCKYVHGKDVINVG